MSDAALVVLCAALLIGGVLIAVQGSPRHARETYGRSFAGRILLQGTILLSFCFALAVPALIMIENGENKAAQAPGGVKLTAAQQKGRDLFGEVCAFCHTLKAADAVGRTGPNLDVLVPRVGESLQARTDFVLSAIESGFAGRYGQMPAQIYRGREAREVAEFVAAVAGK